jgi:hypothetical protein
VTKSCSSSSLSTDRCAIEYSENLLLNWNCKVNVGYCTLSLSLFLLYTLKSLLKLPLKLQGNHYIFHTLSLLLYPRKVTVDKHKIKKTVSVRNIFGTASNYRSDSICYIL